MNRIFIQANNSQYVGALLAKYSIERFLRPEDNIDVEILQVERIPAFQNFVGKTYKHGSEIRTYTLEDEQSFTLTRFIPPEIMNFKGRAIVIDPDVFAVKDIKELFKLDLQEHTVACCDRADGAFWDSSVMLLDCSKLSDWKIKDILQNLNNVKYNYTFATRDILGESVLKLSRDWNTLDEILDSTRMIHYTQQRTQPWKTGLPYTVTPRNMGKMFGIPKKWLPIGRKKYPKKYHSHPDQKARDFFFLLLKDALEHGIITKEMIQDEIENKRIRNDILTCI